MINLRFVFVLAAALLLLTGCNSNTKDLYKGMSAAEIYAQAQKNMEKENFGQAAKDFEALEARYPYGEYSSDAQIGLIKSYYKHNDSELAIGSADRFLRMNPRHPQADYVYYLKGLVYYDQNYSFMFRYLPLDKSARDPSTAQESFDAFKELLERYPCSQYAADARQRMIFLRNQVAEYEMQIVDYYIKRGAYVSAANRAAYVVKHFAQTPMVPRALAAMVVCYREMDMEDLANDALTTLELNFKDSKEYLEVR